MNVSTQNGAYHEREANGNLWRVALFKNFRCGLIPGALSSKHGTRPVDLPSLAGRDGGVAHVASQVRGDL
jgi:hypothetical protein